MENIFLDKIKMSKFLYFKNMFKNPHYSRDDSISRFLFSYAYTKIVNCNIH